MPNGKLLVLDGLDGSGKSTQFELLQTALQKQGVSIQAVSFPDYDSPSAALVKMYLNGELSNTPDGVNAYAASSFYAVDRYANGNKTTDFIRCVAWGKTAENIGKFFHKGDMLAIQGNIRTGSFTDRNGSKHYTTAAYVTNFYFTGNRSNPQKNNTQNNGYQNGNSANYNRNPYPQNSRPNGRSSYQNGYYQNPFDGYETL